MSSSKNSSAGAAYASRRPLARERPWRVCWTKARLTAADAGIWLQAEKITFFANFAASR